MVFPFWAFIASRSRRLGNFSIFLCWIFPTCPRVVCAALPRAIISAYDPFFGAFGGLFDGGGVGWPFLKVAVAGLGADSLPPFERYLVVSTVEGLRAGLI